LSFFVNFLSADVFGSVDISKVPEELIKKFTVAKKVVVKKEESGTILLL